MDEKQLIEAIRLGFIREKQPVIFEEVSIGEWHPVEADCHNNVNYWVRKNSLHSAVRGWVHLHEDALTAHSIVRGADGKLFDITPILDQSVTTLMFVAHPSDEVSFNRLKAKHNILYFEHQL